MRTAKLLPPPPCIYATYTLPPINKQPCHCHTKHTLYVFNTHCGGLCSAHVHFPLLLLPCWLVAHSTLD